MKIDSNRLMIKIHDEIHKWEMHGLPEYGDVAEAVIMSFHQSIRLIQEEVRRESYIDINMSYLRQSF